MTTSFATDIAFSADTYFSAPFAPTSASPRIRLGSIESIPRRGGRYEIFATFAVGDAIISASCLAFGPVEALTGMLYDAGFAIEITSFSQQNTEFGTVTTLRFDNPGYRSRATDNWATGHGDCATMSTARAMVAAANRLG